MLTLTIRSGTARLTSRFPQLAKTSAQFSCHGSSSAVAARAFHKTTQNHTFFASRASALVSRTSKSGGSVVSCLAGTFRGYQSQAQVPTSRDTLLRKLFVGSAIFGGTLVAINVVFNRETREDGGMAPWERALLNSTFMHTGLGIGIIGLSAYQMCQTGFIYRLMVTNPWVIGLGGLALSMTTMFACRSVDPDNYIPKYALWAAFNAVQGAFVAPLLAIVPMPILARAGLYTVAMMGSISYVGATAKQEKYMYLGGPLLAGAAIVAVSGFAPLVLPATAVRTLGLTESIWLWGGLAVFGGFTLYDVQKVLHHARLAQAGAMKMDPVNESISLELDFLNIFVRMVQILAMQGNRRK